MGRGIVQTTQKTTLSLIFRILLTPFAPSGKSSRDCECGIKKKSNYLLGQYQVNWKFE
jgi:hypothetical protein